MTTISIPDSLSRSDEAFITATRLLKRVQNNEVCNAEQLSWIKADVKSLQTFNHIEFTVDELQFFDDCYASLTSKPD